MGFMDKVKAQAEQAVAKAQQGVAQGQTKIDDLQTKRAGDALIMALGTAFYAEQRQGGPQQAVITALADLDAHVAANGPIGATPPAPVAPVAPVAPAAPPAPGAPMAPAEPIPPVAAPQAADPAAGGSFSLDDI
jgi:hypothetical protein